MELNFAEFGYLGLCLEGFFFRTISVNCQAQDAKAVPHCPILGLYSGIFAIYLQHHQSTAQGKSILFYALSVLYALTAATIIIETVAFCWVDPVSPDANHGCFALFQLILQNIEIAYHLQIIYDTLF